MSSDCFDVVIVGAGLSGIGAARHLKDKCPGKSFVILEGRDAMGGTWDLFRFPGIRSDSDMFTLGYNFKPWRDGKAIADGPAILEYIKETAAEGDVDRHIRYGHLVKSIDWSSQDACWTIRAEHKDSDDTVTVRGRFILMCAGYYSYEQGHTPEFKGRERFQGQIVHPQSWPEDLDYKDKKVVCIGSGATAVTLVPAMAEDARHVVMLQRSPTYMVSRPDTDVIANLLRKLLPEKIAYAITRWKNIRFQQVVYRRTRTHPDKVKRKLLDMVRKEMGPDYDIDTHFTPHYNPWDQRLCLVPNSDFFEAIKAGKSSIVTDRIDTFTENGIRLASGRELEADIIVTATGLSLVLLGGVELRVDGEPVTLAETFSYLGMMYSGVPNLVTIFGYINASWTLRADLTSAYACRIINHMEQTGLRQCTPHLRANDQKMTSRPWITDFSSGYMQRVMHLFPKQGDRAPWLNTQNYREDKILLEKRAVDDGVLEFSNPRRAEVVDASQELRSDAA
ncbi:MAG: NAD(P)/FAD-dependent oxidoreductase [Woeseiaceae bacterium]|nr:NAD(P)/FAD-dependent oxidoreductase [Woeseiaceae bacterium]